MTCCMPMVGKAVVIVSLAVLAGVVHREVRPIETRLKGASSPDSAGTPITPTAPHSGAAPIPAPGAGSASDAAEAAHATSTPSAPASPALEEGMISLADAKQYFDEGSAEWVDAREPDEYSAGRIGDAYNMPPSAFMGGKVPDAVYAMSRDKTVVVYCGGGSCDASKLVALHLQGMGFRTVVFHDGWKGWTGAGYPVVGTSPGGGL